MKKPTRHMELHIGRHPLHDDDRAVDADVQPSPPYFELSGFQPHSFAPA